MTTYHIPRADRTVAQYYAHPATAVQTVERDEHDEIVRTVTRYQD